MQRGKWLGDAPQFTSFHHNEPDRSLARARRNSYWGEAMAMRVPLQESILLTAKIKVSQGVVPMYTPEERAQLRADLLERGAQDKRLSGTAITGSAAAGLE